MVVIVILNRKKYGVILLDGGDFFYRKIAGMLNLNCSIIVIIIIITTTTVTCTKYA